MADSANPMATVSANLLSSIPADMMAEFNAAADMPDPGPESFETTDDTPVDDGAIETAQPEPALEAAEPETQAAEPESEPASAETKPPVTETTQIDDLPEGVVAGKNRKGEEGVFVSKERWEKTMQPDYRMLQEVSELLGEPATKDALELRDRAWRAQEKLYSDMESADPAVQSQIIDAFFDNMSEARQQGRVGKDPSITFTTAIYDRVQQKSPEAYAALRGRAARDLLTEVYNEAARSKDKNLLISAGHVARWLGQMPDGDPAAIRASLQKRGIPFYTEDEMDGLARGVDPVVQANQRIQNLEQQLNGRSANNEAQQWQSWFGDTVKAVQSAVVDEAIKPALASIEKAWEPFKDKFNDEVVAPLKAKVFDALKNDPGFNARIDSLTQQAQRATNPQLRQQIQGQIKQAHINRARLAADVLRRDVITRANTLLKSQNSDTHGRRQAAQTRTASQGASAPVPRSLVPQQVLKAQPGEVYDSNKAYKQALQLLGQ